MTMMLNFTLSVVSDTLLTCLYHLQGIDELDMEEDKREIINREIKTFRDLHKVGICYKLFLR